MTSTHADDRQRIVIELPCWSCRAKHLILLTSPPVAPHAGRYGGYSSCSVFRVFCERCGDHYQIEVNGRPRGGDER